MLLGLAGSRFARCFIRIRTTTVGRTRSAITVTTSAATVIAAAVAVAADITITRARPGRRF